ncbi:MAG: hypothetical protein FWF47_04960 [Clostridia bacterium]|nr:hypothetical protein [Clostridia bacterium]
MNERKLSQAIQHAVDTSLSGLQGDPRLARRVMANAKGEIKVKKKLSFGLVLIIALVLAMATALAVALLTPRDIVQEHAIPIANQSEGDAYSAEETSLLLTLATENGITFSENGMRNINSLLSRGEGYYKQELLMELAKAEFGEDPVLWTLEEKKWFDDACVATGIFLQPQLGLPGEGDISQQRAIQIAQDYIHAAYDPAINLNDPAVYKTGDYFINGNEDGAYPGYYWRVFYEPLTLEATGYSIFIGSQGEVWLAEISPGVGEDVLYAFQIVGRFQSLYGYKFSLWSQAELRALQQAVTTVKPTYDGNDKGVLGVMQMAYPDISANAMPPLEAVALAQKAVPDAEPYDDYIWNNDGVVYLGDEPNPVWKVHLSSFDQDGSRYNPYLVEVDSITGDIKSIRRRYYGEDYQSDEGWASPIVLQRIIDAVNETWVDTSESFG